MVPFQTRFEKVLRDTIPLESGDCILVALSGGADSTALLHLLISAAPGLDFRIVAAHLDHGLRPESASEAEFCRTMCRDLNIPCAVGKASRLEGRGSLQMRAREFRYKFLQREAESSGARWIALAHHADDAVETAFLRILSGTSLAGLAAIPPRRGMFFRPLLPFTRVEIESYLVSRGIPWVEDGSNRKSGYRRNFLRNEVFPLLEQRWSGLRPAVGRLIRQASDENGFWEKYLAERGLFPADATEFPLAVLRELGDVPLLRFLAILVSRSGRLPGQRFFTGFRAMIGDDRPRILLERPGICLHVQDGLLVADRERPAPPSSFRTRVENGTAVLPWGRMTFEEALLDPVPPRKFFQAQAKKGIFFLNGEIGLDGLTIRSRQPGDRIRLSGGGSRKIKDLLIDLSLCRPEKAACTVIADETGPFACFFPSCPGRSRLAPEVLVTDPGPVLKLSMFPGEELREKRKG